MKYTLFVILAGLLIASCNNNTPKTIAVEKSNAKDSSASQGDFFPVSDYIGGQLKMIDSFKLPISTTVIINKDTALYAATKEELVAMAKKFQEPDITTAALKSQYKETSIADQSVPSVMLIYTTSDTTLTVQKIIVYLKPDPVKSDKVTSIYIEKSFTTNDTLFNQKLYWKTDKNLQVVTEKKIGSKSLPVEQRKITWDL